MVQALLKKYAIVFASCAVLLGVVFPAAVGAQANVLDEACRTNPNAELCVDNRKQESFGNNSFFGPNGLLTRITRLISIVSGIAGVILIVLGAFRYTMAGDDLGKVNQARDTILYALVGMIIAAISQGIVIFVLNEIGL